MRWSFWIVVEWSFCYGGLLEACLGRNEGVDAMEGGFLGNLDCKKQVFVSFRLLCLNF